MEADITDPVWTLEESIGLFLDFLMEGMQFLANQLLDNIAYECLAQSQNEHHKIGGDHHFVTFMDFCYRLYWL